jgi:hypothetical protein
VYDNYLVDDDNYLKFKRLNLENGEYEILVKQEVIIPCHTLPLIQINFCQLTGSTFLRVLLIRTLFARQNCDKKLIHLMLNSN